MSLYVELYGQDKRKMHIDANKLYNVYEETNKAIISSYSTWEPVDEVSL
jgi:hypothetical protein